MWEGKWIFTRSKAIQGTHIFIELRDRTEYALTGIFFFKHILKQGDIRHFTFKNLFTHLSINDTEPK